MDRPRMCSDLVAILYAVNGGVEKERIVNLEEISRNGASIQAETPFEPGMRVKMLCGGCTPDCEFECTVADCRFDTELGYFVTLRFLPGSEWRPDCYTPLHMLDLSGFSGADEAMRVRPCCSRALCPREVIARVIAPELPLRDLVGDVAREVARLCGGMEQPDAAYCFKGLFRMSPDCRLFDEFLAGYEQERQRIESEPPAGIPVLDRVGRLADLVNAIPKEVSS